MELTPLLIYGVIQATVFLTPVLIIGYRQGKKDQIIVHLQAESATLKKDINSVGSKVNASQAACEEQLRSLSDKIGKIEVDIGKIMATLDFIKDKR